MSSVRKLAVVLPLGGSAFRAPAKGDEKAGLGPASRGKCAAASVIKSTSIALTARAAMSQDGADRSQSISVNPGLQAAFVAQVLGQLMETAATPKARELSRYRGETVRPALFCDLSA